MAHQKEQETNRRHIGELVRGAALRLFNVQVGAQYQEKKPSRFWEMPWDEQEEDIEKINRALNASREEKLASAQAFIQSLEHGNAKSEP